MVVRIRLARFGNRNNPFYRIYVADSRSPRDGKHLEVVGHYDPKPGASRLGAPFPIRLACPAFGKAPFQASVALSRAADDAPSLSSARRD